MSALKDQLNSSLKDLLKDGVKPGSASEQELFQNIINIEVDKLMKDAIEKKKEYERKLAGKTNKKVEIAKLEISDEKKKNIDLTQKCNK